MADLGISRTAPFTPPRVVFILAKNKTYTLLGQSHDVHFAEFETSTVVLGSFILIFT